MTKPWQLVWGHVVHIRSGTDIGVDAVGVGADWQGAYFIKEDGGRHRYEFGGLPCESQSFINSEVGRFPESLSEAPTRERQQRPGQGLLWSEVCINKHSTVQNGMGS